MAVPVRSPSAAPREPTVPPGARPRETTMAPQTAAAESAHFLRNELTRLWGNYSRQSRFFKLRVRIVVVFAVVAVFSLIMAAPPLNTIGAYPAMVLAPDRVNVIVSVENQSSEDWTNVVLELDGLYQYKKPLVRPGESAGAEASRFARPGSPPGKGAPPQGYRPKRLIVECDQGRFSMSLAGD